MSDKKDGHDHDHDQDDFKPLDPNAAADGEAANASAEPEADPEAELADAGHNSLTRALNMSFTLLKALMLVIIVLFFLDCAQELNQNEVGLIRRFGAYLTNADGSLRKLEPGRYHLVWPDPIEKLDRVSLAKRDLTLDTEFWTTDGRTLTGGGLPAQRDSFDPEKDGYNLTGDVNLLHTRWKIEYQVDQEHPEDYLLATVPAPEGTPAEELDNYRPERYLRTVAAGVILRNIAGLSADDVLIYRQSELKRVVLDQIVSEMRDPETGRHFGGIVVTNAILSGVNPPGRVKVDFDQVTQAMSERQTRIDNAEREAKDVRERARSEASQIVETASVVRRETVEYAKADANRVQALLDQFKNDPAGLAVALEQVRLDFVGQVLSQAKLITLPATTPRNGHHVIMIAPAPDVPSSESAGH